jgi:hypothetical protein
MCVAHVLLGTLVGVDTRVLQLFLGQIGIAISFSNINPSTLPPSPPITYLGRATGSTNGAAMEPQEPQACTGEPRETHLNGPLLVRA